MDKKSALGAAAGITLTVAGAVSALTLGLAPSAGEPVADDPAAVEYIDQYGNPIVAPLQQVAEGGETTNETSEPETPEQGEQPYAGDENGEEGYEAEDTDEDEDYTDDAGDDEADEDHAEDEDDDDTDEDHVDDQDTYEERREATPETGASSSATAVG